MTPELFEQQWKGRIVRPKLQHYAGIPDTTYLVTAALFDGEDDGETIFAIMSERYTFDNKEWYTIRIGGDEFEKCMADFEVVE